MRVLKAIALFALLVLVTAGVTVAALGWGLPYLEGGSQAAGSAVVWPVANAERVVAQPPPRVVRFTILAVGDLMTHGPQITSAKTADGYDFTPCFEPVSGRVSAADLAIGNFETVVAGADRGYTGYPTFNAPDEYAEAAVAAGFDVLTTANNHTLDRGPSGLVRTREVLEGLGALTTGTARTAEEAEEPLITDVRGVKVAIIAYTYGMNGFTAPTDKPWMVNVIDRAEMVARVKDARAAGAELVVVSIHNGIEYQRQPPAAQDSLEQAMVDAGADVVLGSHPHVIQPMEVITATRDDGSPRTAFVIHSLGNFVSNQRERFRDTGLMLSLGFEKDLGSGVVSLVRVEYVPVWVDDTIDSEKEHRVLPIGDVRADDGYPGVTSAERTKIEQAWSDTTTHLGSAETSSTDPAAVVFWEEPVGE